MSIWTIFIIILLALLFGGVVFTLVGDIFTLIGKLFDWLGTIFDWFGVGRKFDFVGVL